MGETGDAVSRPSYQARTSTADAAVMNFIGQFEYNLDAKGRLMIPVRFRRVIPPESAEMLVLSKGKERCLNLYPIAEWNEVILKELHGLPPGPQKRNLIRYYSSC